MTADAIHHWSLDSIWDVKDLRGQSWGYVEGEGNSVVLGVHGFAYNIKTSSGSMTLLRASNKPYTCLVNPSHCENGVSVSLWLKHWNINGSANSGQIFLRTGDGYHNQTGFMLYQVNGTFDHLALQVNKQDTRCTYIFFAPEKAWSHIVFVWDTQLKVYWNGELVTKYLLNECKSHSSKEQPQLVLGDAGLNRHVSFDEVTIWNRSLSEIDVKNVSNFYKGAVCLCFYVYHSTQHYAILVKLHWRLSKMARADWSRTSFSLAIITARKTESRHCYNHR